MKGSGKLVNRKGFGRASVVAVLAAAVGISAHAAGPPSSLELFKSANQSSDSDSQEPASAHAQSAALPKIDWVKILGGRFRYGTPERKEVKNLIPGPTKFYTDWNSLPMVRVNTFFMSKTEVTNRQFRACIMAKACPKLDQVCANPPLAGDNQPVTCVTWNHANAFARWVGGRLPSAKEWEYAARNRGENWSYPWGKGRPTKRVVMLRGGVKGSLPDEDEEGPSCKRAVMKKGGAGGCGAGHTLPVCSKVLGNTRQGLCDMVGNVSEWVEDGEPGGQHAMCGGHWNMEGVNASCKHSAAESDYQYDYGFRVARDLASGEEAGD